MSRTLKAVQKIDARASMENGLLLGGVLLVGHGLFVWYPPLAEIFVGACFIVTSIALARDKK